MGLWGVRFPRTHHSLRLGRRPGRLQLQDQLSGVGGSRVRKGAGGSVTLTSHTCRCRTQPSAPHARASLSSWDHGPAGTAVSTAQSHRPERSACL